MPENTKQALDPVRRRRATVMTLSEVLEGEQLMCAMWMIEEKDQSANKFTFISSVGVTAESLGISSQIITELYRNLNKNLDLSDQELADDPMPKMLEYRANNSDIVPTTSSNTASAKEIINAPKETPEMTVFVTFISKIVSETGYPQHDTFNLFKILLKEEIVASKLKKENYRYIISWVDALNLEVFIKNISVKELKIMVQCLYITLCRLFGQTEADMILERAVNQTSKLQAAQSFSPKNFL